MWTTLCLTAMLGVFSPDRTALATRPDYNQDQLEAWWGIRAEADRRRAEVALAFGLAADQSPAREVQSTSRVDFDDPLSVLEHVLRHAQPVSSVYPSERYFYFSFDLGPRQVNGNLRFTEIESNTLHIGYFDNVLSPGTIGSRTFSPDDGVKVSYDASTHAATVTFRGLTRVFEITPTFRKVQPPTPEPLSGEQFVSRIVDESGHGLQLMFNPAESFFYYVRDLSAPMPERLIDYQPTPELSLRIGSRSRFVFYVEPQARQEVLVGVLRENVMKNNPFDGPFDQVPPRLPLRDRIMAAYPYVSFGDGIDEHGNFRGLGAQRVAISAYQDYRTLPELVESLTKSIRPELDGVGRWIMMNYEWKRDFHKQLEARSVSVASGSYQHETSLSRTWPANHRVVTSRGNGPDSPTPEDNGSVESVLGQQQPADEQR